MAERRTAGAFLALLALLALGGGSAAWAYTTLGVDWSWERTPVSEDLELNVSSFPNRTGSNSEIEDALEGAMETWFDEGGAQVALSSGGRTTATSWSRDTSNVLQWHTSTSSSTRIAQAAVWYRSGAEVVDCDVRFYGANAAGSLTWSAEASGADSTEYDLELVALHELGHCLGLDHSADSDAVMYETLDLGTDDTARHLDQDDIDGVQALYGPAAPDPDVAASTWTDSTGDGDGIVEIGESGSLDLEVDNLGYLDADGLVLTVESSEAELSFSDDTVDLGDLASGETASTVSLGDDLRWSVSSACATDLTVTLTFTLTDDDGTEYTDTETVQVNCLDDLDNDGYTVATDCDDSDAAVNPGAEEVCNGVDDDCSGLTDGEEAIDADTWAADLDGDGWLSDSDQLVDCEQPSGYELVDGVTALDCDDSDPSISPAGTEVCNFADDDCDGETDEGEAAPGTWYRDADGDLFGITVDTVSACEQPEGYVGPRDDGLDCDDTDPEVHPNAVETCDGRDEDCDGDTDDDPVDGETRYLDADGDGYGNPEGAASACPDDADYSDLDTDCHDGDASFHPGADEVCDLQDQDCDGEIDEDPVDAFTWCDDADGDGYGDAADCVEVCEAPEGHVDNDLDCDDADALIYPGSADHDEDCVPRGGTGSGNSWYPWEQEPEGCGCAAAADRGAPGASPAAQTSIGVLLLGLLARRRRAAPRGPAPEAPETAPETPEHPA